MKIPEIRVSNSSIHSSSFYTSCFCRQKVWRCSPKSVCHCGHFRIILKTSISGFIRNSFRMVSLTFYLYSRPFTGRIHPISSGKRRPNSIKGGKHKVGKAKLTKGNLLLRYQIIYVYELSKKFCKSDKYFFFLRGGQRHINKKEHNRISFTTPRLTYVTL